MNKINFSRGSVHERIVQSELIYDTRERQISTCNTRAQTQSLKVKEKINFDRVKVPRKGERRELPERKSNANKAQGK